MAKDTKLVHFTIVGATQEEIAEMATVLKKIGENLTYDIEFIVTNEKIELHDVKFLMKELYKLYKKEKKFKESVAKVKGEENAKKE